MALDRGEGGRGTPISGFPMQSCGLRAFSWALLDCRLGGLACACTDARPVPNAVQRPLSLILYCGPLIPIQACFVIGGS